MSALVTNCAKNCAKNIKKLIGTLFNSFNKRQRFTSPYATLVKGIFSRFLLTTDLQCSGWDSREKCLDYSFDRVPKGSACSRQWRHIEAYWVCRFRYSDEKKSEVPRSCGKSSFCKRYERVWCDYLLYFTYVNMNQTKMNSKFKVLRIQ